MVAAPDLPALTRAIWAIADEVLRDIYARGKYRDIILPITVIRRFDAVLEPAKPQVLAAHAAPATLRLPDVPRHNILKTAAGAEFYNTAPHTLRDLRAITHPQRLLAAFTDYLNGFSPNVKDIIDNFDLRQHAQKLTKAGALGALIEKITSPDLNLSPRPAQKPNGDTLPALDNHGMGTLFEELIRLFNEENNEEAGEHWTPRDIVRLMTTLMFQPIRRHIAKGQICLLYDGACGTGGMLTVAQDTLRRLAPHKDLNIHLYGQEINAETYAICKADLLIKGDNADNIVGGAEHSTLSADAFPSLKFDFMLSNPPYGKNWKADCQKMGGKDGMTDPRFLIAHANNPNYSLIPSVDDGQLLFLANKLAKMKPVTKDTPHGSRIAHIHNGSSLFKGAPDSGESNIRRLIIESDWLEAIIALPQNIFYNTGIPTYIWIIANRKAKTRAGKVQLIDATQWQQPLRRNLGSKNCELSDDDIQKICDEFSAFAPTEHSRILDNDELGYWQVAIRRPLRSAQADPAAAHTPAQIKHLRAAPDPAAPPVIAKVHPAGAKADPLHGKFAVVLNGKTAVVEYAPDPALADSEQIPLNTPGGIAGYMKQEVWPHAPDAWVDAASQKIGYELNFNRYFYRPQPLRQLRQIGKDLRALHQQSDKLLADILQSADQGND